MGYENYSGFVPTIDDIRAAAENVYRHLKPTPLFHYAGLSELIGAEVWVKHENHQPVGAFKIRGGINLVAKLNEQQRRAGIFTASTGNHGQSIAMSAQLAGIKARIAVPEGANPGKVKAMRAFGAEVIHHGPDFDTAREWIAGEAEKAGGLFVGPTHPDLICGVGSYALEILQAAPDCQAIIVPVGGGSGVCGTAIVAKAINPDIKVIGAQSAQAPAAQLSWRHNRFHEAEMNTFAEGVATRVPFENAQHIMQKYLDDFILVDDADIERAVLAMFEHTRNMVEGAGAIPLAAAAALKDQLAGKKIVLVQSGGNMSMATLKRIVARYDERKTTP